MTVLARAVVTTDEAGVLTRLSGRVVPYNTAADIGAFVEVIAPGAFASSLRERPSVPLFLYHADVGEAPPGTSPHPVGISESFDDRPDGLYAGFRLDTGEDAQLAGRMAKAGILAWLSVRFMPTDRGSVRSQRGGRLHVTRTKVTLISVSLTSTPAYVGASVGVVRSMGPSRRSRRFR